jgi:hypothetical protein
VGKIAEDIVVQYEQNRLTKLGRKDLAQDVHRVSENNTLGYDVLSYEKDGSERQIEVKGSTSNSSNEFFLTGYELCASQSPDNKNYYLYLVHKVGKPNPFVSEIKHPLFELPTFDVEAMQYAVRYQVDNG